MTCLTHADLVKVAGRWLRNTAGCSVVLEELCAATGNGENPDAIGWYTGRTLLVECKVSRSDFLADRKKPFRADPARGLGQYRYFMAPKGLLRADELPPRWGLLEVSGRRVFLTSGHEPKRWYRDENPWEFKQRFHEGETQILLSAMARIKVRVGATAFHSMLHQRLMQPVQPPSTHAADTAAAWEAALTKDAA
ncbi:hypothetical protein RZA67_09850 [Stenotrophomonas sp. C3(2023)]|uniref:hypothetical protein n=1 Tax=Stenotrophomonas sp. C3(2023) TaxID=3080277 RepID=UPI00293C1883|nr:hypothetical protein [Stenotrophomonas sp. C3(2023)]MDV3469032.1 hypothetical protein [Stenotrophomonas sp. C3(2023)]